MENNIFSSVVKESAVNSEENAVLVLYIIAGPAISFNDSDDVKGSGLNE